MARSKLNLENTASVWDANRRYKVNDLVYWLGKKYQNLTGKNSEPGVGADWFYEITPAKPDPIPFTALSTGVNQTFTVPVEPRSVYKSKGLLYKNTEWSYYELTLTILVSINLGNTIYVEF